MKRNVVRKIFALAFFLVLAASSACLETASNTVSDVTGGTPASSATSDDSGSSQGETEVGTYVGNGSGVPSDTEVGTYVGNGSGTPGETNVGTYVGNGTTSKTLISFVTVADETNSTFSTATSSRNSNQSKTEVTDTAESSESAETTETVTQTADPASSITEATGSDETSTSGTVSASSSATIEATQPENTDTPLPKPGLLPLKKVARMALASRPLAEEKSDPEEWPYDYCYPVNMNGKPGPETQKCLVTPKNYNLGILEISLVKCLAGSEEVACAKDGYDSSETLTLYEGPQINTPIGDVAGFFSESLNDIGSDISAGGLKIAAAYFEQMFPTEGEEAEKIAEHLRGKSYRICMSDASDPTTMLERCGNAEAEKGDLLVDADGDGNFGFLDESGTTETAVKESPTRPEGSTHLGNTIYYQDVIEGLGEVTLDFGGTYAFGAGRHYQIAVAFNVAQTLLFHDGNTNNVGGIMGLFCVQALSSYECPADDADPFTVGMYNPYYDSGLTPIPPAPTITIQEIAE